MGRGGGSNIFASVVERLEAGLAVRCGLIYKHIPVAHVPDVAVHILYCMSAPCPRNITCLLCSLQHLWKLIRDPTITFTMRQHILLWLDMVQAHDLPE